MLGKILAIPVTEHVAAGTGLLGIGSKIDDIIKNGLENISDVINSSTTGTGWAGSLLDKLKDIGSDITNTEVIWHGPGSIGGVLADVADEVWDHVREIPNGNAIEDALNTLTENISVCNMTDISL